MRDLRYEDGPRLERKISTTGLICLSYTKRMRGLSRVPGAQLRVDPHHGATLLDTASLLLLAAGLTALALLASAGSRG